MARSTIEISGHIIIDSRILPKVLDIIINLGGVLDSSIRRSTNSLRISELVRTYESNQSEIQI